MDESINIMNFDLDDQSFLEELVSTITPPDLPDFNFYELKSKAVSVAESPTIKTETPKLRTQFKQFLMRDQEIQKEQGKRKIENKFNITQGRIEEGDEAIEVIPRQPPEPIKGSNYIPNVELPPHVLKVATVLENPTKYHMLEKRKNQIQQYFTSDNPLGRIFVREADTVHSAPVQTQKKLNVKYQISPLSQTTVPSPEILSPGLNSIATSEDPSDAEELIEGILSLEEASAKESALQTQSLYGSMLSIEKSYKNKNSNSCPSELFKQELSNYSEVDPKDKIRKENHNMIERKRRYNINDRIKELGDLLPKNNEPHYNLVRDNKLNKGTILKSSVDYVRELKNDIKKMKQIEVDNRELQAANRKLLLRIQQLERQAKDNGLPVEDSIWKVMEPRVLVNSLIKNGPVSKNYLHHRIPDLVCEANLVEVDDKMEDDCLVNKDLMLCSSGSQTSSPVGSNFCDDEMDMNTSS